MPTSKLLRALPTVNWDIISASDAAFLFLPSLSASATAILLLLSASQAWVSQRRYELSQPLSPILKTDVPSQFSPESESQLTHYLPTGEQARVEDTPCICCGLPGDTLLINVEMKGMPHGTPPHEYQHSYKTIFACGTCGCAQLEVYSHDCWDNGVPRRRKEGRSPSRSYAA